MLFIKNYECEELSFLETVGSQADRVKTKISVKEREIEKIKKYLPNIRNENLKLEISRLLEWLNYNSDPPSLLLYKYPSELKGLLSKIKRYDHDLEMICQDVNSKFKNLS